MQFGVVFPQTEFPADPVAVRDYAQTVEALRLTFVDAYDHVLGANPNRPGGWRAPYTFESSFLEPFVLFSFMAAATKNLRLATNIIILPQRQTALVAKQAATLDLLSGGRVRLGVGLGWNEVEYVALGENFRNRGRRIEEQVEVLRALWTLPLVNFKGRWHQIQDAGIKPLPVQRPIPIWMGGTAENALRRIARIADAWMSNFRNPDDARPAVQQLRRFLEEAGRDPAAFPIEARLPYGDGQAETWHALIRKWQDLGATYFSLNTMGYGFDTPAAHLNAIREFAQAVEIVRSSA
jgi:probable F420-dependent oxidoreductase